MYALIADADYNAGSIVQVVEFDPNIAVLRAVTSYDPLQMQGSIARSRLSEIENHPLDQAGVSVPAHIHFVS